MKHSFVFAAGVAALTITGSALAAVPLDYSSGHEALEYFDQEAMATTPTWVKVWIGFLMACFAASLLFVWKRPTARWVLGGFLSVLLVAQFIFEALGLPYLSGAIAISHLLFWTPALIVLLRERAFLNTEETKPYRIWTGAITFTILLSFIFDIRDAATYIAHFAG